MLLHFELVRVSGGPKYMCVCVCVCSVLYVRRHFHVIKHGFFFSCIAEIEIEILDGVVWERKKEIGERVWIDS